MFQLFNVHHTFISFEKLRNVINTVRITYVYDHGFIKFENFERIVKIKS